MSEDKTFNGTVIENLLKKLNNLAKQFGKVVQISGDESIIDVTGEFYPLQKNIKNENNTYFTPPKNYTTHNYGYMGSFYKEKLDLTKAQVKILDKIAYRSSFLDIGFCRLEVVKLYLEALESIRQSYKTKNAPIRKILEEVSDVIARKYYRYRTGSRNYKYCIESSIQDIHSDIFKRCENALKDYYRHTRKTNVDTSTEILKKPEIAKTLGTEIFEIVEEALKTLIQNVPKPDQATEIELNRQNAKRWQYTFEEIKTDYNNKNSNKQSQQNKAQEPSQEFLERVLWLAKINESPTALKNIFSSAFKFLASNSPTTALSLSLHQYIVTNENTYETISKKVEKEIFKTPQQKHEFEEILKTFKSNRNLEKALQGIADLYTVKRKKIQLDHSSIKEVQKQHAGTVELLNEYLQDEEDMKRVEKVEVIEIEKANTIKQKVEQLKQSESQNNLYKKDIRLTTKQLDTLHLFAKSSLSVSFDDFEKFAKVQNAFKNQLIESINEAFYDLLDDILIEEDGDFYSISESYYQKILQK